MSSRVFKNYQVNMGVPFSVKVPLCYDTIEKLPDSDHQQAEEEPDTELEVYARMLEKARKEASLIINEAKLEAACIVEEAGLNGRIIEDNASQRGYREGMEKARLQYEDLLQEAEFIREHARVEYSEVLESIETDAVGLILDIARKVIGEEVRLNNKNILFLIRQAFGKCSNKEDITLRVAAEDYEYVEDNKEELLEITEGVGEFEIKRDTSLKTGACILETPLGNVDAGVQTKLDKIEEEFRNAVGK